MMRSLRPVLLALVVVPACQREAEWSPPQSRSAEQRPTNWDATTRDRLGLPDLRGTTSGQAGGAAAGLQFAGSAPTGWSEQPAQPGRFRDRIWTIGGAPDVECYLTNAVGGGVQQNVARWFGQFGIRDVKPIEALPVVEFAGKPGRLLELSGSFQGKAGYAMLLAFTVAGDSVTTLKMTGPEADVAAHKEEFLALAKGLRAASASPMPEAPPIERGQPMPDGHPPIGGDAKRDTMPPPQPFAAEVPAGWQPVAGTQRLLHHSFGSGGEVYVSQLGGTMRAMLDIWRGEIAGAGQLSEAEFAAVPKVPMLGGQAHLLDVAGDYRSMGGKQIPGGRLLVAAIEQDGAIVFAKLFGTAADVEAQREGFLRFCATLRRNP
ncbi:MAG: hypothetical protein JNL08_03195 [Planctomycetes bacterium]|nr:hypothetical protein [Planctomycetota bacterium]